MKIKRELIAFDTEPTRPQSTLNLKLSNYSCRKIYVPNKWKVNTVRVFVATKETAWRQIKYW